MASLHMDAATSRASIQESTLNRTPRAEELFDGKAPVIRAGRPDVPSRPGGCILETKRLRPSIRPSPNPPEYRFGEGSMTDR